MGAENTTMKMGSSQRRRGSGKSGRRFSVKGSSKKGSRKKGLPTPAAFPRKAHRGMNVLRTMAIGAFLFVFMSTAFSWRARARNKRQRELSAKGAPAEGTRSLFSLFSFRRGKRVDASTFKTENEDINRNASNGNAGVFNASSGAEGNPTLQSSIHQTLNSSVGSHNSDLTQSSSEGSHGQEEALSFDELPERIEWYTRDDFKDGTRPMCRISKPILLSNGTILVPNWMAGYERLLQRCGLGTHSFYSVSNGPEGLDRIRDIDADFALTIHPEKFQEPTHDFSVFLTEHILKSSYLFDIFGGHAQPAEAVREHQCYTMENDSSCTLPRPVKALMRPALFVPKKIELSEKESWTHHLVNMFGVAHGNGRKAIHLNTSTILLKVHEGKSENLIGTSFNSILTTDGMFRHLPTNGLQHSNFFSEKNDISKGPKPGMDESKCQLLIGIAKSGDAMTGIDAVPDLKEKIDVLSRIAVSGSQVETKIINYDIQSSLQEHVKDMQDIDIYIGGSGDEMSSIGFLRAHSSVVELMPFGVRPNTHTNMARILGLQYVSTGGKPQIESFKRCIDGEIFNLRKKGKLSFTETPEWHDPLIKAWDDAVSEFVLQGKVNLDLLNVDGPIRNYHSKVCALRQKIEVGIDEVARKIVLIAKDMCSKQQSTKQEGNRVEE